MDRERLAELTKLYNPTLSDNQIQFMANIVKQGFDPKAYWVGGKAMDLTAQRLSSEEMDDIQYQVQIDSLQQQELAVPQQKGKKKSLLADLHEKQAVVKGDSNPKGQNKSKSKEME